MIEHKLSMGCFLNDIRPSGAKLAGKVSRIIEMVTEAKYFKK